MSKEIWACKVCGKKEEIDIDKPLREIGWDVVFDAQEYYCPDCRGEREFECPNCEKKWKRKQLRWYAETEADEAGVYVVYNGYTPCCYEPVDYEFGYETDPEEPLRHEF